MRKALLVLLLILAAALLAPVVIDGARRALRPQPESRGVPFQTMPVSPTATPPPTCEGRLQTLVDAAEPGATVLAPACLYRETVRITKPLTLDGQGKAELRGSDVWTDWSPSGRFWVSGPVPALPTDANTTECQANTGDRCQHAEQVFLDGKPLSWVATNPRSGQFALDGDRNLILADDPAGRTVEVTTRQRWVDVRADNITIQGFTMRHAGSAPNVTTALGNQGHADFTLQNNVLSDAHGSVVSIDGGSGARVLGNEVSRGGQIGISGWAATGALIQGNKIHDNAVDGYSTQWAAGGLKVIAMVDLILDGNEVWNNQGAGLWCDIDCTRITVTNNRIHHNAEGAIYFEISDGAEIYNNVIWDSNGGIGISSSGNADVHDNTIIRSPGTGVWQEDRPRPAAAGTNDRIHDNVTIDPADGINVRWWQVTPGTSGNLDQNNVILTGPAATDWIRAQDIPLTP